MWRGAAFHFLPVFSKKKILWKLWLWFSKMFHQRVFSDWLWRISKFPFWRQILDIYRQPLLNGHPTRFSVAHCSGFIYIYNFFFDGQFRLFSFSDSKTYLDTEISIISLHFGGLEITLVWFSPVVCTVFALFPFHVLVAYGGPRGSM